MIQQDKIPWIPPVLLGMLNVQLKGHSDSHICVKGPKQKIHHQKNVKKF